MHTTHIVPLPRRPALELGPHPLIMGILNVTPDSFSDGGLHNTLDQAVIHAAHRRRASRARPGGTAL